MFHPSLFDEPPIFDRDGLAAKLQSLARQGVWIGTSSWKYEGWLGQIYTRERYLTRGRFSRKLFEESCIQEYAEVFPIVGGDFSFYQFPSEAFWKRLFTTAPPQLLFALKVPEEITVKIWPMQPRYGARAGRPNEVFLNAQILEGAFVRPLLPWRDRIAVLIFEFGTFPAGTYRDVADFLGELDPFLEALPAGFRYSVEIRNPEFLVREYLDCLRKHNVAHVFNAWTRMPEIPSQLAVPGVFTADFTVARALLKHGRPYAQAVELFSPYRELREENPSARQGLKALTRRALKERSPTFLFVNNRLEGNSPMTIEGIIDEF
jgi:Uncharacterized conserved protein